jgi:hypothetical protein
VELGLIQKKSCRSVPNSQFILSGQHHKLTSLFSRIIRLLSISF